MKHVYKRNSLVGERMGAYFVDHLIFTFVFIGIILMSIFAGGESSNGFGVFWVLLVPLAFAMKDTFDGRSLGKRVFGLGVRQQFDLDTAPSFGRLFLRNLTLLIWPVEFLVMVFNQDALRIGDHMAGTMVVKLQAVSEDDYQSYSRRHEPYAQVEEGIENDLPDIMTYPKRSTHTTSHRRPTSYARNPAASKKALVVGIGIVLAVCVFVSALFFVIINFIKNDSSYITAEAYIKSNPQVMAQVGQVESFGWMPTGSVSRSGDSGRAELNIKVNGSEGTAHVFIYMTKARGEDWEIIEFRVSD